MIGTYANELVLLSILIAIVASFVALDLASRVSATRGSKAAPFWLAGGALSMGTGIWAMHFIGMLAFVLPVPVSYDIWLTLLSLLVATLASALALSTVSRDHLSLLRLTCAGLLMGCGIATMHYLGMEAMRMRPRIDYDAKLFALSVAIAIGASCVALWIAYQLRRETIISAFWRKFLSALVMGVAIVGMHYTGMSAARFAAGSVCVATTRAVDSTWMAGAISAVAMLFLVSTLLISVFVALPPTIRSRLIFLVMGSMVPVSMLAVGFVFYDYHRSKEEQVVNTVAIARAMTAMLDKDLASIESGLTVLGTSQTLADNNYAAFYRQAEQVVHKLNATAITLSDATGQQLIDTRRPYGEALPSYGNTEQAQRIFESGLPNISDFFIDNLNRQPVITVGVPVRRGDAVVFQITASLLSDRLTKIFTQQALPSNWIVAIFDGTGTIMARSHESARFVGKPGAAVVLKRLNEVGEGSVEAVSLEGVPVISNFSRSPTSRWTVVVGIPTNSFTSGLLTSLWWLLFVLLILLASSLTLAWFIGGSITRSIHALTSPALALGSGGRVTLPPLGLSETNAVAKALMKASEVLAQAQHQAHHDVLTGLANRAMFNEILRRQLMLTKRTNGSLAVMYIDLDGFKAVNDTLGHDVGDDLLKAVAARMQVKTRECDLVARLGGDEFAVVLIEPGAAGAVDVAAKLVDCLSIPFPIGAAILQISASVGVAIYPGSATTCEALISEADEAMYSAKKAGKNRYVVASGA
jgi:diguanylate cyclase (GGDEF)-like protein